MTGGGEPWQNLGMAAGQNLRGLLPGCPAGLAPSRQKPSNKFHQPQTSVSRKSPGEPNP